MKKLLLILLLISMQSHSMDLLSKTSLFFPEPFPLLSLPDDLIREVLLIKIDIYSMKQDKALEVIKQDKTLLICEQDGRAEIIKHEKTLEIIKLCNLMANTGRKMKRIINSQQFIKAMADRFEKLKSLGAHKNTFLAFYAPTKYCYLNLVKELLERFNDEKNNVIWNMFPLGLMMLHASSKKNNNTLLLEFLISNKADPNIQDGFLEPPLHIATLSDNIAAINLLIKHGASIDKHFRKETALHQAAKSNRFEATKCLLDHGASTEVYDHENKTPLDLARDNRHQEIVNLIESHKNSKNE